jgi:SAM-dependent methyltransferase
MLRSPIDPSAFAIKIDQFQRGEIVESYFRIGINVENSFSEVETIDVYKCKKTGYRFFYPFSISGTPDLYEQLQARKGYYRIKNEHKVALGFIKKKDKVLEIGCGEGLFLNQLKMEGVKALGLEFNDLAIKKASIVGLDVIKKDIFSFAQENKNIFDVVCCFQVLEHITDVKDFLDGAILALKKKGRLILGIPNNNPYLYRNDRLHALNLPPHHMGLWDRKSISFLPLCFPLRTISIRIEPLRPDELLYYVDVNFRKTLPISKRILIRTLSMIRPHELRDIFFGVISNIIEGRNILAVYEKI